MKSKNPLYVVKGKTVLEANGLIDLVIKKFNLTPVIETLMKIVTMLLNQVKDYQSFEVVKKVIDSLMERLAVLGLKFHRA